ncbi:BON domain-containing protein [Pelistega europaea]|uniref:BON domain-containing protein n=1 Tax=Pelistega europaea TaxID=106147 RepID=A0A7Y4P6N9_9BURK|nr:BON domain-containing protein [Pelistega europaea]NOL49935.1 BON domain-containing protein [Pelistega europaea]
MKTAFRPVIIAALVGSTLLSGCITSLVLGGAAAAGLIVSDRRTAGMQLTDKTIVVSVESNIKSQLNADTLRVNATSMNQRVLLTGEVANQADKEKAGQIARGVKDVKEVVNELMIGQPAPFSTRSRDSWISSKVRSELLFTKNIPSRTISITTSQGVVYLMGNVTQQEGDLAAQTAASVAGVVRVVKVFDIITSTNSTSSSTGSSGAYNSSTSTTSSSTGMQTAPLKD